MEIKIRYTFKRKNDGHIFQNVTPIECLENKGDKPFVLKAWEVEWDLLARDLWIGVKDTNSTDIFVGDIIDVCVFLVSPANPDNDQHFRGEIIYSEGKFCLKITHYKTFSNDKGEETIPLQPRHLPFCDAELEDDGSFTVPFFDFIGISGNLGEYNSELIEVIGNIHEN